MIKRLFLLSALVAIVLPSWAVTVSRQQARQRAEAFLCSRGLDSRLTDASSFSSRRRAAAVTGNDSYYVFNIGSGDGFIVMAADDCVDTVLGYSTGGTFDADNLPDGLAFLLSSYEEQIAYARSAGLGTGPRRALGADIAPMVQTHWNQRSPYNDKCITVGTSTALTGCVATAMAQVMNYWQYPSATLAAIPQYTTETRHYSISGVPAGSPLSWDGTDDFVATLCSYCGKSVKMDYDSHSNGELEASSAALAHVVQAMKDYFGYYQGMHYYQKNNYQGDWAQLVYDGLLTGPVLLGGQDASRGGHVFICDGYQGSTGLFHMNWGWGGQDDNYFQLLLCNPTGYQFSNGLEALVNIKPDDGSFSETPLLTVTGMSIKSGTHFTRSYPNWGFGSQEDMPTFVWALKSDLANSYDFEMKLMAYKTDDTDEQELASTLRSQSFDNLTSFTFTNGATWFGNMTGTYRIIPVCRLTGTTTWTPCTGSDAVYLTAVITSSTLDLFVGEPGSIPEPEVTEAQLADLYNNYSLLLTNTRSFYEDRLTGQDLVSQNQLLEQYQVMANQVNSQASELSALATQLNSANLPAAEKNQLVLQYNTTVSQRSEAISGINALAQTYNSLSSLRSGQAQEVYALYNSIATQYNDLKNVDTKQELAEKQQLLTHFNTQLATSQSNEQELGRDLETALSRAADVQQQVAGVTTAIVQLQTSISEAVQQAEQQQEAELARQRTAATGLLDDIANQLVAIQSGLNQSKDNLSLLLEKTQQNETLHAQLTDSLTAVCQQLEADTLLTDSQRTPLGNRLSAITDQLQQLQSQTAALQSLLATLEGQLSDGFANITAASAQAYTLREKVLEAASLTELSTLQGDIDNLQSLTNMLQTQADDLKPQLASDELNPQATADGLTDQATALQQLAADVAAAIAQAEADKLAAEQARRELAEARSAANDQLASLLTKIAAQSFAAADLAKSADHASSAVQQIAGNVALAAVQLNALTQQLAADTLLTESQHQGYTDRLTAMKTEAGRLSAQLDTTATALATITKEIVDLQRSCETATQEAQRLQQQVDAAQSKAEVEQLQTALDKLAADVATLTGGVDAATQTLTTLTDTSAATDALATLNTQLTALSTEVTNVIAQAKLDDETRKALAEAQRAAEDRLNQLRESVDSLMKQVHDVAAGQQQLGTEVTATATQLQEVAAELAKQLQQLEADTLLTDQQRQSFADRLSAAQGQQQTLADQATAQSTTLGGFDQISLEIARVLTSILTDVAQWTMTVRTAQSQQTVDDLKPSIDRGYTDLEKMQQELAELQRQTTENAPNISTLQAGTEALKAQVSQTATDLTAGIAQALADKQAAEAAAEQARKELEAAVQAAQTEQLMALKEAQTTAEVMGTTIDYIGKLTEEINTMSESWAKLLLTQADVDSVLQTGQLPAELLATFQQQYGELADTLETLTSQRDSLIAVAVDLAQGITDDSSRLTFLTDSLAKAQTLLEIATTKEEAAAQQQAFKALATDFAALTAQMADRQQALAASVAAFTPLLSSLAQVAPQLQALLQSVDAAKTSVDRPQSPRVLIGCYDLRGRAADPNAPGPKIFRYSDGSIKKVVVKP